MKTKAMQENAEEILRKMIPLSRCPYSGIFFLLEATSLAVSFNEHQEDLSMIDKYNGRSIEKFFTTSNNFSQPSFSFFYFNSSHNFTEIKPDSQMWEGKINSPFSLFDKCSISTHSAYVYCVVLDLRIQWTNASLGYSYNRYIIINTLHWTLRCLLPSGDKMLKKD